MFFFNVSIHLYQSINIPLVALSHLIISAIISFILLDLVQCLWPSSVPLTFWQPLMAFGSNPSAREGRKTCRFFCTTVPHCSQHPPCSPLPAAPSLRLCINETNWCSCLRQQVDGGTHICPLTYLHYLFLLLLPGLEKGKGEQRGTGKVGKCWTRLVFLTQWYSDHQQHLR